MKKIITILLSFVLIIFGISGISPVSAATCPFGGSPNWKGECDTTTENGDKYFGPPMTEQEAKIYTDNNSKSNTTIPTTSSNDISVSQESNISEPISSTSNTSSSSVSTIVSSESNQTPEVVVSNPDVFHGYAAIDLDGNVLTVIVCNYNVCEKNSDYLSIAIKEKVFPPGTRLVFQTLREENTGNVAGYMNAKFDEQTKSFTITDKNGAIFHVPIDYPGSQELTCIQNCDAPAIDEENQENISDYNFVQENDIEENLIPMIFSTKLKPNTFATIVAKNKNKTKIWKTKVNKKGNVKIKINKKYKKWKFKVKVGS